MKNIIKKNRGDLFSFSFLNFLFKNKTFLFLLRITITFLFFYAIFLGFIYPTKEENVFTTALFWSLFWSFFMVLSLGTLGRIFCGICPHGFLGKYITKLGLKKKIPKKLANPFIGLSVILLGYWLMIFLFPGIYSTPYNTAIFFALLTLLAFVFYYLYDDMSYCKYICPLGTVTKAFSKVSFTKLETYNEGCSTCKTFDCAKACTYNLKPFTFAKKNSMEDCTLCMDCAVSCENVAFNLKKPSSTLLGKFKTQKVEVWTILILTAILSFSMTFKHALNRTSIADEFIWNKISVYLKSYINSDFINVDGLSVVSFSIFTIVLLNTIGMFIASRIMKTEFQKTFYTLSYALAPLFIIGGLSHILEFFFLHYTSNIVNAFNQAFYLGFTNMEPLAKRGESWLLIFKIFTHFAYIWAFILMIYRLKLLDAKRSLKVFAYPFVSIVIISYMSLTFYTAYVFKTYGVKKSPHNQSSIHNKKDQGK
ncbi:4Fe-4S binding protein [Poseidonibacter lekithochrous]|uniref:4Fe-4S binding protein n=1 Tax=Poseidonibacter TaxID=2321187 RepID=UPI001C09F624|nr:MULTISPECIES: 4Fe-4S binding protein [Poseidonibacter]MBU3014742.1 4Fe-4S binding protein [Poseidonibacter lekithochrous]MDO6828040.1 4Fe-4S binding protein [Poseidonibacter sp. 1_MG-2023]